MKRFLLFVSIFACTTTWAAELTGIVRTDTQSPVAGAVVSDGFSVVKTDANGGYTMPYNSMAKFVFISVPSGYDFPTDETGSPKLWQLIDHSANTHTHDFTLHPNASGVSDGSHVLVVMGDPQVLDAYCLWRFRNETIKDLQQLQASYPAGTRFVGLIVGDLVWDQYQYFSDQKTSLESIGFPTFVAIGNHDHNRSARQQSTQAMQDSVASMLFEETYGPTYFSFNIGNVHYVVLDNVYYKGYQGGDKSYTCDLTDKEKAWVKKDIAQLQEGTQVVYAMHINCANMHATTDSLRAWAAPLDNTHYIMSGHVHSNSVTTYSNTFIEHNVAACQGSYWCSDWCADGAPNGYKVFEVDSKGICNWYYKGTGLNSDDRIRTFPLNSINAGNSKFTSVMANVWDYDEKGEVSLLVNGVPVTMKKFTGTDPKIYDVMLDDGDTRPNYPGSEGGTDASKNPGSKTCNHIFYYTPKATEKNADFVVQYTDRFGKTTSAPILKHMMVASFTKAGEDWTYTQDFNTLPNYPNYLTNANPKISRGTWVAGHTPEGWYAAYDSTGYNYIRINNGSQNISWLYSYGEGNPNVADQNSSERALGSLNTSNRPTISYGLIIENNTGTTITSLGITYTGEVWRIGSNANAKDRLDFSYAVLTDAEARAIRDRTSWIGQISTTAVEQLAFTTPDNNTAQQASLVNAAIDGNNANNRTTIGGQIEVNILPGQVILLRWDDRITSATADQGLAIDDLSIVANPTQSAIQPIHNTPNHNACIHMRNGQVLISSMTGLYSITGQTLWGY